MQLQRVRIQPGNWHVPAGTDNHWLRCLVDCAVAGSIHGAVLFGTDQKQQMARPRLRMPAIQKGKP